MVSAGTSGIIAGYWDRMPGGKTTIRSGCGSSRTNSLCCRIFSPMNLPAITEEHPLTRFPTESILPYSRNNGAIERSIDLLGVGSLIKLKQYQIFLTVIAHLKQSNPDIKAVLCGHGPEERRLAGQINELNLKDNVRLTGEIPHETVIEFMLQSKILVHPSSYEGYSAACLEALYAGCHVVSFVAGEKREIDHWHIVSSVGEMIERCHDLMLHEPDFNPHLVHHMDDVAQKVLNLLEGGGDVTTS